MVFVELSLFTKEFFQFLPELFCFLEEPLRHFRNFPCSWRNLQELSVFFFGGTSASLEELSLFMEEIFQFFEEPWCLVGTFVLLREPFQFQRSFHSLFLFLSDHIVNSSGNFLL